MGEIYIRSKIFLATTVLLVLITLTCVSAADNQTGQTVAIESENDYDLTVIEENQVTEENHVIEESDNGTFTALQEKISNAEEGSTVTLENDYTYDEVFNTRGIVIEKTLTIDGKGYTIDAKKTSRIFNITAANVVLKNINFINAYSYNINAGAIYLNADNASFSNCRFENNSIVYGRGAGIYMEGSGNSSFFNCSFINNYADYDGVAIYSKNCINLSVCNSKFKDNKARYNYEGGSVWMAYNDNFSIFNCSFENSTTMYGGAVYVKYSKDGSIFNCSFVSIASSYGAVCSDGNERLRINNCSFTDCSATTHGGAIAHGRDSHNNHMLIDNCSFYNCYVGGYQEGGAIYLAGKGTVISNCYFEKVHGTNSGGAIWLDSVGSSILNCYFVDVYTTSDNGGAIHNLGNDCNITGCSFINTSSVSGGGSIWASGDNLRISNCKFLNSSCNKDYGGAIYSTVKTIYLIDCTFVNDTSKIYDGGAVHFQSGENAYFYNCTFVNNSAARDGGAILTHYRYMKINIFNSTFINNKAMSAYLKISNASDVIILQFSGRNNFINAIYSAGQVTFTNVTYWNGDVVNTDDITPIKDSHPGVTVTIEVYDSKGFLVDNATLRTDENNKIYYEPYHLDDGNYTFKAYHMDDSYYSYVGDCEGEFTLKRNYSSAVAINIEDNAEFEYGSSSNIPFTIANRTDVRVVITKDGAVVYNQTTQDSSVVLDLAAGDYNITVYNQGNKTHAPSKDSKLFKILKVGVVIYISQPIDDAEYVHGDSISLITGGTNLEYVTVNLTVYDENENIVFSTIGLTAEILLPVGGYNFTATVYENENYTDEISISVLFHVIPAKNSAKVEVDNVPYGINSTVTVTADVDGEYTVDINGTELKVNVVEGKGTVSIALANGTYYANVTFGNTNYTTTSTNTTFNVQKVLIEAADAKYGLGDSYVYEAKLVCENGTALANMPVTFKVNGATYNATTDENGTAKVTLTSLNVGSYDIAISYLDENATQKITVSPRIVESKDLIMDYDSKSFTVKAIGDDGNPIANEVVKMSVNGVVYNVKTDKNGVASLPIKLKPKTYTITCSYKGTTVKNTIKVKYTLKAKKTVKVKKTAKKLVLKATLKWSNGKAIVGKKITFKFKGKIYTVKTNKKGLAKVIIKKKVLKKLKKGKTYKANIIYKNETVTTKVKVKK